MPDMPTYAAPTWCSDPNNERMDPTYRNTNGTRPSSAPSAATSPTLPRHAVRSRKPAGRAPAFPPPVTLNADRPRALTNMPGASTSTASAQAASVTSGNGASAAALGAGWGAAARRGVRRFRGTAGGSLPSLQPAANATLRLRLQGLAPASGASGATQSAQQQSVAVVLHPVARGVKKRDTGTLQRHVITMVAQPYLRAPAVAAAAPCGPAAAAAAAVRARRA